MKKFSNVIIGMKDYRKISIVIIKLIFYFIVLPIILYFILGKLILNYFDLM